MIIYRMTKFHLLKNYYYDCFGLSRNYFPSADLDFQGLPPANEIEKINFIFVLQGGFRGGLLLVYHKSRLGHLGGQVADFLLQLIDHGSNCGVFRQGKRDLFPAGDESIIGEKFDQNFHLSEEVFNDIFHAAQSLETFL